MFRKHQQTMRNTSGASSAKSKSETSDTYAFTEKRRGCSPRYENALPARFRTSLPVTEFGVMPNLQSSSSVNVAETVVGFILNAFIIYVPRFLIICKFIIRLWQTKRNTKLLPKTPQIDSGFQRYFSPGSDKLHYIMCSLVVH